MANFVSYANATELMTEIGNKFDSLGDALEFRGSITFANIPATLTAAMTGYVYNISDDFTTDSRFIEGIGKSFSAGTDIAVVNTGDSTTPVMKLNVMSAFVNTQAIYDEIENVADNLADEFDATSAYVIGDAVVYENALYKFKAAHTANDPWDATEVDAITMESLISAAEPDSLTTEQINALLTLLS
jgi:hypothetical protein